MLHDEVGRQFRPGCDLAEAARAYRRAKRLDPSDIRARANLAVLLEYGHALVRYGPGARLEEAVEEWRSIRDTGDTSFDAELLIDLAWLDRLDELEHLLPSATGAANHAVMELFAITCRHGIDAALARAKLTPSETKRSETLLSLGRVLLNSRRYAEASAALHAAANGSADAAALRWTAELVGSLKKAQSSAENPADPKGAVAIYLRGIFEGVPPESISAIDFATSPGGMTGEQLVRVTNVLTRRLASTELTPQVIHDVVGSKTTWSVQGDASSGYRVEYAFDAPGQPDKSQRVYLIYRNARPLILDVGIPFHAAGHILDLANNGQLDAAGRWLDWAAAEFSDSRKSDPLASPNFPKLWKSGDPRELDRIRRGAAALGISTDAAPRWIPILEAAREGADAASAAAIDALLLRAYLETEQWTEVAATAERALSRWPDSDVALELLTDALLELKRFDELEAAANRRLSRSPGNVWAWRALCRVSTARGPRPGWDIPFDGLVSSSKAELLDFNNYAWAALAFGRVSAKDLDHARRAASAEPPDWWKLHTLAALLAELGRSTEAREALVAALNARDRDKLSDADWYVVGRIAENVGEWDAARDAYARVPPEVTSNTSVAVLVRRRLAAMDAAGKSTARKVASR